MKEKLTLITDYLVVLGPTAVLVLTLLGSIASLNATILLITCVPAMTWFEFIRPLLMNKVPDTLEDAYYQPTELTNAGYKEQAKRLKYLNWGKQALLLLSMLTTYTSLIMISVLPQMLTLFGIITITSPILYQCFKRFLLEGAIQKRKTALETYKMTCRKSNAGGYIDEEESEPTDEDNLQKRFTQTQQYRKNLLERSDSLKLALLLVTLAPFLLLQFEVIPSLEIMILMMGVIAMIIIILELFVFNDVNKAIMDTMSSLLVKDEHTDSTSINSVQTIYNDQPCIKKVILPSPEEDEDVPPEPLIQL